MKGLILKDLMCLRKRCVVFVYIVICVFVVSVMYVLSANSGNIAKAAQEMMNEVDAEVVKSLSNLALILFMMLPPAVAGDVSPLFCADEKAEFSKLSGSFPISIEKRVLSRYITLMLILGSGMIADTVMAVVLSVLTDLISFELLFATAATMTGAVIIYASLFCAFMFIFGYGKENIAQCCSILMIIGAVIILNFKRLKNIIIACLNGNVEGVNPISAVMNFMMEKYIFVILLAIVIMVGSYILSVFLSKRKRGII